MQSRLKSAYLLVSLLLEVLLPLQCSSSPSLVVGRQKHVADFAEGQAHKSSVAADGAPDPPENLRVLPVSDKVIQVVWDPPSDMTDVDHYYVYVEGEDMDGITTAPVYIFQDLVACTNYTFGVQSVSAADAMSDPLLGDGETDVGAPPPPRSLQVDDYTATTVTLSWDKPDTLCDVEEYRVKWSDDGIDSQNLKVNETSITVTELSKNTNYTFDVSGFTSVGEGAPATVHQTTAVADGGPPEDLVAVGINSSSINVTWSPPSYEPNYYRVSTWVCIGLDDMVSNPPYIITGRDPCESCDVTVTSVYGDIGYGATTRGSSLSGDPPIPTDCSVNADTNVITVSWTRPITQCLLGRYSVNYTWTKLWGDGKEGSDSKTTPATELDVLEPLPYSTYSFKISSSIDDVYGSPTSCSGTSLETLPGAPVILNVDSEQGTALVTWETPVEENGAIVNYGIYINEEPDARLTVEGDVHSASVALDPCVSVNISVKARNGAGWGPPSDVAPVFIVDGDPPPPTGCSVNAEKDVISVSWQRPDTKCPLGQYSVNYTWTKLWGDGEEGSDSKATPATEYYVVFPVPYSTYSFNISSSINGVYGSPTSCSGTSLETPASPPTELVQLAMDVTSVTVQWSLPEFMRGILGGWHLNWTNAVGDYVGEQDITNPVIRVYQIGDLAPSEVYIVYVMAVNGAGKGEAAMLETSTEYVPSR